MQVGKRKCRMDDARRIEEVSLKGARIRERMRRNNEDRLWDCMNVAEEEEEEEKRQRERDGL